MRDILVFHEDLEKFNFSTLDIAQYTNFSVYYSFELKYTRKNWSHLQTTKERIIFRKVRWWRDATEKFVATRWNSFASGASSTPFRSIRKFVPLARLSPVRKRRAETEVTETKVVGNLSERASSMGIGGIGYNSIPRLSISRLKSAATWKYTVTVAASIFVR